MFNWGKIEAEVENGYISKRYNAEGTLAIYNYTAKAQWEHRWNDETLSCRGLIVDQEKNIVARGFDKFFNWTEGGRISRGHIVTVTEKLDGSLGILYRDGTTFKIATRGSFESPQAQWATERLQAHDLSSVIYPWTLLFEIIYPENRVIVDYGGDEGLYLLAVRNRFTGDYLPFYPDVYTLAHSCRFPTPKVYSFNNMTEILEQTGQLGADQEGFVVEFSDGQRFKIKGDRYIELHRLVSNLSFKHTLEAFQNDTVENLLMTMPDEFYGLVHGWVAEIQQTVDRVMRSVNHNFEQAPKASRKEFALWTMKEHKDIAPYLFAKLDGKDILPMIYKTEFQNRKDEKAFGQSETVA